MIDVESRIVPINNMTTRYMVKIAYSPSPDSLIQVPMNMVMPDRASSLLAMVQLSLRAVEECATADIQADNHEQHKHPGGTDAVHHRY